MVKEAGQKAEKLSFKWLIVFSKGNGTANHRTDAADTWSLEAEASSSDGRHEETSRTTRMHHQPHP